MVAAFGYNCAMAQAPVDNSVINTKQGPVVKAKPGNKGGQTVSSTRPAVKHPHIKPYTGKKNIRGAQNGIKQKAVKPQPRPCKGQHMGHSNGKGLGHAKHGCQKPPQQQNNSINRGGMLLQSNNTGVNRGAQQPAQQNNSNIR